jgi:hypothetical protein
VNTLNPPGVTKQDAAPVRGCGPPRGAGGGSHPYEPPAPQDPTPAAKLEKVTTSILAQQPDRVVVDLDVWRWRPWPGWWGAHELRCWAVAERSRRAS